MTKHTSLFSVFLVSAILLMNANTTIGTIKYRTLQQDEREAQNIAQEFVKRFQKTRDVEVLTKDMFLDNFISHFVSGDKTVPLSLYLRLTNNERFRLFVIQSNISYLQAIDVLWRPEKKYESDEENARLAFQSILPNTLAEKIKTIAFRGGRLAFADYRDFRLRLPEIEKVLAEARSHLIKQGIEQTPKFQKELDDTITNEGINYRVRTYIGGDDIKDCERLVGFPKNQKFYRVETPLFLGVILVKVKNQMKIVRLTVVDGD